MINIIYVSLSLLPDDFLINNIVSIIALLLALVTFSVERCLNYFKDVKDLNKEWYIDIIINPNLQIINEFYKTTEMNLVHAVGSLKTQSLAGYDQQAMNLIKFHKCQEFKKRRKEYFNDLVSMITTFDPNIAVYIDRNLNKLDDLYVNAIDNYEDNYSSRRLYENKALLYQILFSKIS